MAHPGASTGGGRELLPLPPGPKSHSLQQAYRCGKAPGSRHSPPCQQDSTRKKRWRSGRAASSKPKALAMVLRVPRKSSPSCDWRCHPELPACSATILSYTRATTVYCFGVVVGCDFSPDLVCMESLKCEVSSKKGFLETSHLKLPCYRKETL